MIWTFGRGADACGRDADDFASRVTSIEASNIARACIFVISGDLTQGDSSVQIMFIGHQLKRVAIEC
jgi:hypothetical protein|eukprot:31031-Pelagococcus_subviridis.AAC.5